MPRFIFCEFCYPDKEIAEYLIKLRSSKWKYVCKKHFVLFGCGLGDGKGTHFPHAKEEYEAFLAEQEKPQIKPSYKHVNRR